MPEELKEEEQPKEIGGSGKIDERFCVMTVAYKPEVAIAENDTVSIMGEFTNWMPEIMERYAQEKVLMEPQLANAFFYKTKLLRGYKYRYNFSVGDQFVIDSACAVSEDRYGKMTNFITVPDKSVDHDASSEEQKAERDLEEALKGLTGEGDADVVGDDKSQEAVPLAPLIGLLSMPSYVNTEMSKMLPKDIL